MPREVVKSPRKKKGRGKPEPEVENDKDKSYSKSPEARPRARKEATGDALQTPGDEEKKRDVAKNPERKAGRQKDSKPVQKSESDPEREKLRKMRSKMLKQRVGRYAEASDDDENSSCAQTGCVLF